MGALLVAYAPFAFAQTTDTQGPKTPFAQMESRLVMPAPGRLALQFGDKTVKGDISKSISIATPPGAPVVAPSDGVVVFADEFRDYGKLVIISPGKGYHIILAGLAQVDVNVGQIVSARERIGTMPLVEEPMLNLELQKDRRPIDPAPRLGKE